MLGVDLLDIEKQKMVKKSTNSSERRDSEIAFERAKNIYRIKSDQETCINK